MKNRCKHNWISFYNGGFEVECSKCKKDIFKELSFNDANKEIDALINKQTKINIMSKKSKGLGDTIQKITKALKIPTCKKCDERRKQLNKAMPYVRKMTNDEYNEFIHFTESDKLYTLDQQEYIIDTLAYTTGIRLKTCSGCTPQTWEFWINKIKETIKD